MAINVFEMFAKLNMDSSDFESGLDKASSTAKTFLKGIGISIGAVSTGIAVLTKKAVDSYADYQQNLGGVQKLYGNMGQSLEEYANSVGKSTDEVKGQWEKLESAQSTVLKNAQNAYKTAGMSANQYMETATQFSASLISSLGGDTQKSAEMTDVAMRAISDNWNTFGGDLESITNAYKGFSKQNFTMLDNLKLGYGGTKEEMQRLIDHANKLGEAYGVTSRLSIDSFADIVTAIQAVQQEQNIAGTTAREASTTVSGSINMAKMAWENLVTGFGDGTANLDALIGNLVDSIIGYTDEAGEHVNGVVDNLMPVIQSALTGIATAIQGLIPIISEQLPTMISTLLPIVLESATNLVTGLISSLPAILQVLINSLPVIISTLMTGTDWSAIGTALITCFTSLFTMVDTWLTSLIPGTFTQKGADMISNIASGLVATVGTLLSSFGSVLGSAIQLIISYLPQFLTTAVEIVGQMALGIINNLPQFITSVVNLIDQGISTLMANLPQFLQKGVEMVTQLALGIAHNLPAIVSAILNGIIKLISTITSNLPQFMAKGGEIVAKLASGIVNSIWNVAQAVTQIVMTIAGKIGELPGMALQWGKDIIQSFINGIKSMISSVGSAISSVASKIKSFIHFSEPDEGPLSDFHTYAPDMMRGFAKGIKDNADLIESAFNESLDFAKDGINATVTSVDKDMDGKTYRTSDKGIVINVYASEGMDIDELVEEIMIKLEKARKKEEEVFA